MEQLRGYKTNCGFSLGRPRFRSIKVKIPRIKPFVAEKGKEMDEDQVEEDDEAKSIGLEEEEEDDEAKSIGLEEEADDDHGAKSMDLEEGGVEEEEKKHICTECGREFKSGKALGGHKRIHALETSKFSMRPKMVAGVVGRSERGGLEVACCVCYKKFTSMKALYGHMRFHPDRGWKGVLPPLPHPLGNSSSSTLSIDDHDDEFISSDYDDDDFDDDDDDDDDDENSELWDSNLEVENVVDLKESIKGWSKTGKRGRRSALKVEESDVKDPPSEDMKDVDVANGLLFLANTAEEAAAVTETSTSNLVEEKYQDMNKMKRKKKQKRLSEMEKESSSSHDQQLEAVVAAEEGGAGAREKHVCVTCNKSFISYQALGGHRASHNKVKILENHQARANAEASLLGTEATITGLASAQGSNTSLSSSNNGEHICNICHRSFSSGQALGGHKRCHWTGPVTSETATAAPTAAPAVPAAASSSQVTETVQEVKKLKRMVLEFDLNELPPNEEEEERV